MDIIYGEILEDGTIKSTIGKVGALNHQSADLFVAEQAKLTGGKATRTRRGGHSHGEHHHHHDHEHEH